ncbi:MAG: RNHCP domain-containing protein [Candidatus Paceibacterota bacterium]
MSQQFQRNIENFTCESCGLRIKGNGYTNHCPQCLYSKHVDVNPGDRAADCGGLMEPVMCEAEKGGYVLTHKCGRCGYKRRNKVGESDNKEVLVAIAQSRAV